MKMLNPQERRKTRRIKIGQPMKIRPSDPKDKHFEDTNTTKNVSRDGVYYVTRISTYYEGMRLFVIVPHHMPREPQDREYLGQVVRIDKLPASQWGVAVQLLSDWRTTD
jgi:PilZ domain